MIIVGILVDLFVSLINVALFIIFVCSFAALTFFSFAVKLLSGRRLVKK